MELKTVVKGCFFLKRFFLHEIMWRPWTAAHFLGLTVLVSGIGLGMVYKKHHKVMGFI